VNVGDEWSRLTNLQRATMNILEDMQEDSSRLGDTQRALMNMARRH